MPRPPEYDCVIVGGGLVGACLALALSRFDLRIALIERSAAPMQQRPSFDDRALALNLISVRVLEDLDLWLALAPQAAAIRRVHVSERGRFGVVNIDASQYGLDALGHVVTARNIGMVLLQRCAEIGRLSILQPAELLAIRFAADRVQVDIRADQRRTTLDTRLLVGADGTDSTVCALLGLKAEFHDYQQTAVLTNIVATRQLAGVAYERFTSAGPVALLPMHDDRTKCVWVEREQQANELLQLDEAEFERRLGAVMGGRLGALRASGRRQAYPLRAQWVRRSAGRRYALIGNAATTLHPNGAQGFNLGLRDVAVLARVVAEAVDRGADPGLVMSEFVARRRPDRMQIRAATHGLARMFYTQNSVAAVVRHTGMLSVAALPCLQAVVARGGMGFSSGVTGL